MNGNEEQKVCVYCGSSRQCDAAYQEDARELGSVLAQSGFTVVFGGGRLGSMGALAEGVLAAGGKIVGIVPEFMVDLEWSHSNLTSRVIVRDMHERKRRMLEGTAAAIGLPGGCGTMEELLEAITWKRLGLYCGAIVVVNTQNYFQPLLQMLEQCVSEKFMDPRHRKMWNVVSRAEEVPEAIRAAAPWSTEYRKFAVL